MKNGFLSRETETNLVQSHRWLLESVSLMENTRQYLSKLLGVNNKTNCNLYSKIKNIFAHLHMTFFRYNLY